MQGACGIEQAEHPWGRFSIHTHLEVRMDPVTTIQVGQKVPDFTLTTFEPETGDFGQVSLEKNKAEGKWTILFFYPAAFTFV
jgi:hypothetical protein